MTRFWGSSLYSGLCLGSKPLFLLDLVIQSPLTLGFTVIFDTPPFFPPFHHLQLRK